MGHDLREQLGVAAAMLLVLIITVVTQAPHTGFWNAHHGWTSVHGLALMTHATPDTGFVAYTQAYMEPEGVRYIYFDRYPVGFTVLGNLLLRFTDDLQLEVHLMRQFMNLIYLGVLFMAYRLVRLTVDNRFLALATVVLAGSSFHMLYYKDMIHYDTPVLLGLFLVAYTIARYQAGHTPLWGLIAVVLVTMCFGRGYVIGFALAPWAVWAALQHLTQRDTPLGRRVMGVLRLPALWVTVIAVAFGAAWLAYNTTMEARTRGIPITETSIVDSMQRQLPFLTADAPDASPTTPDPERSALAWGRFLTIQTERIALWAVPLKLAGDMPWRYAMLTDPFEPTLTRLAVVMVVYGLAVVGLWHSPAPVRLPLALSVVSGLLWLYLTMNLAAAHIYVTMYALGLVLLAYTALLRPVARWRWAVWVVLALALGFYTATNLQVRAHVIQEQVIAAQYTTDFSRVRASIREPGQVTRFAPDFPRGTCIIGNDLCFAPGYFLGHNHYIALDQTVVADYLISPHTYATEPRFVGPGMPLTLRLPLHPQNQQVYYYDLAASGEVRTAPNGEPLAVFGGEMALGDWGIVGDQTVRPCEARQLESWWVAATAASANYNLQAVLVADDGGEITQANRPLGTLPTSIWERERYMLDVRTVHIPCDTPPASYPLILGMYNPDDLIPLGVTSGGGTLLGNQYYLTNLVVSD